MIVVLVVVSYGLKASGLYRHRRGLGLHRVGYNGRRSTYPYRQACLPRQGKSLPDTGQSLQSCIFIVQESGRRYSPAIRTPPNPGIPHLPWEKCLALGSILRCPFPVTKGAVRHVLYCCHRGVFIILHEFIPLHHVILLKALLCSYELNTLDACWIAVDVWSNSSRCRQESVYLSRT